MGYEGLWEDRERLNVRLTGILVPNVMKNINGQSKGIKKSHNLPGNVILTEFDAFYADQGLLDLTVAWIFAHNPPRSPHKPRKRALPMGFFDPKMYGVRG